MSNEQMDIPKIVHESRETLLNSRRYFSTISLTGGFAEPVIKAAVYGIVAGLFALLWSLLGLSTVMGAGGFWGGAVGIMALIWSVIGSIIAVFIGGAVMLVLSAICRGNTDFEANLRVAASLMVLFPVNAFLSFFYGISLTLGALVGLLVSLFAIYLFYQALTRSLKGNEGSAKAVAIILVILALLGFWTGRKASRNIRDLSVAYRYERITVVPEASTGQDGTYSGKRNDPSS